MRAACTVAFACAGLFLLAGCASTPPPVPAAAPLAHATSAAPTGAAVPATVARVIDGDTVIINFDGTTESVRLIGIDTPEPEGGYRPPECYGDEASEFTRQLLPEGTTVLVTRDVEPRDVYDRLLGYLYRAEDNLFVNLAIVESGFADTLNIAPNDTYAGDFMAAAAAARSADLGLWGACGGSDVPVSG